MLLTQLFLRTKSSVNQEVGISLFAFELEGVRSKSWVEYWDYIKNWRICWFLCCYYRAVLQRPLYFMDSLDFRVQEFVCDCMQKCLTFVQVCELLLWSHSFRCVNVWLVWVWKIVCDLHSGAVENPLSNSLSTWPTV